MSTDESFEMPDITGAGAGNSSGVDAKISFLSGTWVNKRIFNVTAAVERYLDKIIDSGLLVDGFAPFESPITDDLLTRMSPDQFRSLFDSEPTLEGRAALIARMKNLKLPLKELLPRVDQPFRPDGALANEPTGTVSSSETTV